MGADAGGERCEGGGWEFEGEVGESIGGEVVMDWWSLLLRGRIWERGL